MLNFSKNIIPHTTLVRDAIELLNSLAGKDNHTLFVLNEEKQLVGTLSDGDIRRGMLANKTASDKVTEVMQCNFKFLKHKQFTIEDIDVLRKKEINIL